MKHLSIIVFIALLVGVGVGADRIDLLMGIPANQLTVEATAFIFADDPNDPNSVAIAEDTIKWSFERLRIELADRQAKRAIDMQMLGLFVAGKQAFPALYVEPVMIDPNTPSQTQFKAYVHGKTPSPDAVLDETAFMLLYSECLKYWPELTFIRPADRVNGEFIVTIARSEEALGEYLPDVTQLALLNDPNQYAIIAAKFGGSN